MSKEIEALERLYCAGRLDLDYVSSPKHKEDYDLIERTLKSYEMMKNTRFIVVDKNISDDDLEKLKNQRIFASSLEESKVEPLFDEETQKKLQALEIIKEKNVDVVYLRWQCNCLEDYNENNQTCELDKDEYLTQQEYDLLKEIFDE